MIYQQLQTDQLVAMKAKEMDKLQTIRGLISSIKNKEIDKGSALTDDEVILVLQKAKKECLESIDSFTKGGREDLLAEAKAQMAVVASYLPAELTDEELKQTITTIIEQNKAAIDQNPKALIGLCMKALRGKAESNRIMQMIQAVHPV